MTINKQILHIVVEIIVISGVAIYFSYKHKKLVTRVEELYKQLEIQNEIIQKHEQIINQLIMSIQSSGSNKVNYHHYTGDSNDDGCKPKKINKHKDSNVSKKITKQKILITKQEEDDDEQEEPHEQEEHQEDEEEEVEKQILKNKPRSVNNVSFNKKPQIYEYTGDTSSEHESELDTEIASELNELEEGLKKKN